MLGLAQGKVGNYQRMGLLSRLLSLGTAINQYWSLFFNVQGERGGLLDSSIFCICRLMA